jgi:hypothetical protein
LFLKSYPSASCNSFLITSLVTLPLSFNGISACSTPRRRSSSTRESRCLSIGSVLNCSFPNRSAPARGLHGPVSRRKRRLAPCLRHSCHYSPYHAVLHWSERSSVAVAYQSLVREGERVPHDRLRHRLVVLEACLLLLPPRRFRRECCSRYASYQAQRGRL